MTKKMHLYSYAALLRDKTSGRVGVFVREKCGFEHGLDKDCKKKSWQSAGGHRED
jgi:hypothetical protein